ncbi:hypothetical protein [Microvirga antarctica]|uniref:hypothetical protein n=1 Tax=Microvirga antarctica TaxID=2819233 RepID=UPI001B30E38F|nr:hypothetical protein [Microvirga antarctica]
MRQCDRFAGIILGFFVFHQASAGELTCTGPFASDTTQKRLAKVFGKTNVVREWMRDEGIAIPASVIFPNDPLRRVEVVWWNSKARRWPSSIHSSSANWSAPSGIRVGMSLEQIARINGRSFTLYGFDRTS